MGNFFNLKQIGPTLVRFLTSQLLDFLCLTPRGLARNVSKSSNLWWNPYESYPGMDGFEIVEGDILLPKTAGKQMRNALQSGKYLWENGVVPYEFGKNFHTEEKKVILSAMEVLEKATCVDFVERQNQETFIRFKKGKVGCSAPIGRAPGWGGALIVNLQPPMCLKKGIIEHELLHVLGLYHEQSRADRDKYIKIHWRNIVPSMVCEFRKLRENEATTYGVPYDYLSIMHYNNFAFSKNGNPTISARKNPRAKLGQISGPSAGDIRKIRKMYNCTK